MFKKFKSIILILLAITGSLHASLEMVLLKNGERVPKSVVVTTMMTIDLLLEEDPVLFVLDLLEKAKNPNLALTPKAKAKLIGLAMLNHDGTMHSIVRAIILSSVEGEGLDMKIVNPVQQSKKRADL